MLARLLKSLLWTGTVAVVFAFAVVRVAKTPSAKGAVLILLVS